MQYSIRHLKQLLRQKKKYKYRLSCYMVQVFFSEVTDIIKPKSANTRALTIRMDENYGIVTVDGATRLYFDLENTKGLIQAYEKGIDNRRMRETFINETFSRSHLIFAVMIEITKVGED